jgi:hypothetical protein
LLVPILSQINPIHNIPSYFSKIYFNIVHPPTSWSVWNLHIVLFLFLSPTPWMAVETNLQALLTSALVACMSASCSSRFTVGKEPSICNVMEVGQAPQTIWTWWGRLTSMRLPGIWIVLI